MGKFNFKDEQDFQKVSSDAEAFYVAIGEIHCPYFGEKIIFNTAGSEFIAVLDNVRVKVIVKQINSARKFFWSIIPYWKIDSVNSRRILHSGKPEND